ncbi:hypothetical protein [Amycolatopsis sp. NPDC049159]|uniref:hypothetical protein n=1 Tax=Amycolatopsis sp. NPDC049159 TaxID=3157210 RepID=UPI0033F2573B
MPSSRLRTANYSPEARQRLGDAVTKAREALSMSRPQLVAAAATAGVALNKKSLELVETGQPGVGQSFLYALGRFLPAWTEDTPRMILEGDDAPSSTPLAVSSHAAPGAVADVPEKHRRIIAMTERELAERIVEIAEVNPDAAVSYAEDALRIRREHASPGAGIVVE